MERSGLERHPEAELHLALLVAGSRREDRARSIDPGAGSASGIRRRSPDCPARPWSRSLVAPAHCTVLKRFFTSARNSSLRVPADREQARIAHVDVVARRQTDTSCAPRRPADRLPMPSLFSSRLLRSVTGMPLANCSATPNWLLFRIAPAMPCRRRTSGCADDAADEGVALVEDVRAPVGVEAGRVAAAAGVALHRERAGDRRVVLALAQRVGQVPLDAAGTAPRELQRHRLVGRVADRLRR